MARGWPAFWTTLIALPFLLGGAYVYVFMPEYPTSTGTIPMFFALFLILLGLYVHVLVAPEPPSMQPGESMHVVVSPFSWAAVSRFPLFVTFFVVTIYLRFRTDFSVIFAAASMVVCLYFLVTGLVRYWKSTLTVHYVTNRRIITDYRFLWLIRVEVPLPEIVGLEQRKTIMESLLGIGNVVLVTGAGGRRPARVEMHDIREAMQVRKTIAALRFAHTGEVDGPEDLEDDSLLSPIVDAPSDRIERLVSDLLWSGSEDTDTDGTDRAYTIDTDLDISLSPSIGGSNSENESNRGAASKLVGVATRQAVSLGASAALPVPLGLVTQLQTGSKNARVVAGLLKEHLDDDDRIDLDTAGNAAAAIKEKIEQ